MDSTCPPRLPSGYSWSTPRSIYTSSREYYRTCQGLTSIPADIPAVAREVWIIGNNISTLDAYDFKQLTTCTRLVLRYNEVSVIQVRAFSGLIGLSVLDLRDNVISQLETGTFYGLRSLVWLWLENNALTSLSWTVFTSVDYKLTMKHPASLQLWLKENPIQCNSYLCWMKLGEKDGWLT